MNQDNRHILWNRDDHPTMELLQQYKEEALPPALRHQLEHHLLDCTMCSDIVEGQTLSETARIDATEKELNKRIVAAFGHKKQKAAPVYLDWRVAAAIVLILCSAILVVYYNYQEIRQQEPAIASEFESTQQKPVVAAEEPVLIAPENMANAVPDTVRPSIAAGTVPPAQLSRTVYPKTVAPLKLETASDDSQDISESTAFSTDEPAVAKDAKIGEPSKAIALQGNLEKTESIEISRALQGRAAGVSIRGSSSISTKQVQGQVLDPDGQPLPGVAVVVKGTTTGAATDANGNFTISLPPGKTTLAFNYIGFNSQERAVDANTAQLTVNLQPNTQGLSEVVVTGYGTTAAAAKPDVQVAAKPVISRKDYRKYLEQNIRYGPDMEKGRVVVQAVVSPTGALQNLRVTKSLCPSCDEEALRLIQQGPTWKPATHNGSKREQEIKITVRFRPVN